MKQIVVISEDAQLLLIINRICAGLVPVFRRSTLGPVAQLAVPTILVIDSDATRSLEKDLTTLARLHAAVTVLVVVSDLTAAEVLRAVRHGISDCIVRPLVETEVRRTIARHLPFGELMGPFASGSRSDVRPAPAAGPGSFDDAEQAERQLRDLSPEQALGAAVRPEFGGLLGYSAPMCFMRHTILRVAQRECRVMITGETGSGKDLVARAIHLLSPRSQGPFVALNVAAIPSTLMESELFGVVRGAFTDAAPRPGVLLRAHQGTLFLDEIGELSPEMQAKLLRVLEDGAVVPVGGSRQRAFSVRVVAATNQSLSELMRNKRFRSDLFFRLTVIRIPVPPLRDRRQDLPLLVPHLLERIGAPGRLLTPAAWRRLGEYHWPGNVRELIHVLERAVTFAEGGTIDAQDVDFYPDMAIAADCAATDQPDPPIQFSRRTW